MIDNHFALALVKLIPPFWGKPRIAALLQSYVDEVQELETQVQAVLDAYDLDTATIARLKALGAIVGQPDPGLGTETYRLLIRARIAVNMSRGLQADIINVLQIMGFTDNIWIRTLTNATVTVALLGEASQDFTDAAAILLPDTRGAGIQMHVFFAPEGGGPYDFVDLEDIYADAVDPITTPGLAEFDVRVL